MCNFGKKTKLAKSGKLHIAQSYAYSSGAGVCKICNLSNLLHELVKALEYKGTSKWVRYKPT